uniref:Uncharacterized protein n=1 Tax=Anguilla anguilla TaxID=7936 RepID=A0A0E9QTC3_ANGAN
MHGGLGCCICSQQPKQTCLTFFSSTCFS